MHSSNLKTKQIKKHFHFIAPCLLHSHFAAFTCFSRSPNTQGAGVEKNLKLAMKLYEVAARKQFPESQYSLACLKKMSGDLDESEDLFESAANQGHVKSMYNLGCIRAAAKGRKEEAMNLFKMAAEAGHIKAAVNLGTMLGGDEGDSWLMAAADAGDPNAMFNLGVKLKRRGEDKESVLKFQEASNAGHVKATYQLAKAKMEGLGCAVDLENAAALFDQCADDGDDKAARDRRKLARILKNNKIVKEQAEERDREAARQAIEAVGLSDESESNERIGPLRHSNNRRGKPTNDAIARVKAAVARRKKMMQSEKHLKENGSAHSCGGGDAAS